MSNKVSEQWAEMLRRKGYIVTSEQSNNCPTRLLYTVKHPSYCNGTEPILSGIVSTQLKAMSICDSNGWERRNKQDY